MSGVSNVLKVHHYLTAIHTQWFPKMKNEKKHWNQVGVGGFQKSYVISGCGILSKYLLFLTGVGGWSGKG